MGADRMYVTVEPLPGIEPGALLAALPTDDFFEWERVENGYVRCCRDSHDRAITHRMLEAEVAHVRRASIVEIVDSAGVGMGFLYERVDDELVLVDRTNGGEVYGVDVSNYLHWRDGLDATSP